MRDAIHTVLRHGPTRVALALGAATAGALQASRLTAVHGVESAVALGAVLPPAVAVVSASLVGRARAAGSEALSRGLSRVLGQAALAAGLIFALPVALLGLASLSVRNCTPLQGFGFMLLGPGAGVCLALVTGLLAGLLTTHRHWAAWLAVTPPLLGIALAITGFFNSPAVFFYGHYFGYFPGAIYDELVGIPTPLSVLRVGTVGLVAAGLCLARAVVDGHLRLSLSAVSRPWLAVALGCALPALAIETHAPELGLRSDPGYIREVLGATHDSARCHLVLPGELSDRALLGEDCDFRVRQMERFFGLHQPGRVTVYVFRSGAEKRALMGAGRTNIAKPWRREIYLQVDSFPHPVMAHELAHIVVGNTGVGPLRVSGSHGGLWPNPGIIEGMAVAADFHGSDGLTPHQWSRAAVEQGRAPPLSRLLGPGFLATHKRLAYALAGSFLRFVRDRYGRAALRRIYLRGDVAAGVGVPLTTLEASWHAFLRGVPLPTGASALASQRFAGRSVLSSVCPHRVAELKRQMQQDLSAGRETHAIDDCRAVLEVDAADTATRAQLAALLARTGDPRADSELAALDAAGAVVAATQARQAIADARWRSGDLAGARAAYTALLDEPQTPDALRLLQVKQRALSGTPRQAELLQALLAPEQGEAPGRALAVHLARELRAERRDGLPHYLEGRQLYYVDEPARAAGLLDEALSLGLPTRELSEEALRLSGLCHMLAGDDAGAALRFRRLSRTTQSAALRYTADDFLSRLVDRRAHR